MDTIKNIKDCARIVVKIGSSLVVKGNKDINEEFLKNISEDLLELNKLGKEIVIVSSGAIALGRKHQKDKKLTLAESQAASAIGQIELINGWKKVLEKKGLKTAQILITANDTENRKRYLNARATFDELLKEEYIPIVNENDTVATSEIKYGDNDRLAARISGMISADSLVLLSNVEGLYSKDPSKKKAEIIREVNNIDKNIISMAGGASDMGQGGMVTKIEAAKISTKSGCYMIISSGKKINPLISLEKGKFGTWFLPQPGNKNSLKKWISGSINPSGTLYIDNGAHKALMNGKSLLPAGIFNFEGTFEKGDTIIIELENNNEVARGLISFNSADLEKIIGKKSEEIENILGYLERPEVVHRNNLVYSGDKIKGND